MTDAAESSLVNAIAAQVESALSVQVCCLRCGFEWTPRTPHPRCCAFCHSAYWDTPPRAAYARHPRRIDYKKQRRAEWRRTKKLRKAREIADAAQRLLEQRERDMGSTTAPAASIPARPLITVPPPPRIDD